MRGQNSGKNQKQKKNFSEMKTKLEGIQEHINSKDDALRKTKEKEKNFKNKK